MDVPGAENEFFTVGVYECFGSAALIFAIIMSGGHFFAGPFTLMIHIIVAGPISGGHANSCLSLAVFIANRKYERNLKMLVNMIGHQIIGAVLGTMAAFACLRPRNDETDLIPQGWLPLLCPVGLSKEAVPIAGCDPNFDRDISSWLYQVITTFVFIFVCMVVIVPKLSPTECGPIMKTFLVIANLIGSIRIARNIGGACFNPLIALALQILANVAIADPV